jgi:hypothetical protein
MFFENTNLTRGFIRLLAIASLGFFCWGAYYDFSPTTWLYGSRDYNDVIERASFDLTDENCKKSKIKYVFPIDDRKNIIYLVCDGEKEGFCKPIENCNGLEGYASILGKDKLGKELSVSNLTPSKIKSDIKKVEHERLIDMLKERGSNGLENLLSLWVYAFSVFIAFHLFRWTYNGFKKD